MTLFTILFVAQFLTWRHPTFALANAVDTLFDHILIPAIIISSRGDHIFFLFVLFFNSLENYLHLPLIAVDSLGPHDFFQNVLLQGSTYQSHVTKTFIEKLLLTLTICYCYQLCRQSWPVLLSTSTSVDSGKHHCKRTEIKMNHKYQVHQTSAMTPSITWFDWARGQLSKQEMRNSTTDSLLLFTVSIICIAEPQITATHWPNNNNWFHNQNMECRECTHTDTQHVLNIQSFIFCIVAALWGSCYLTFPVPLILANLFC